MPIQDPLREKSLLEIGSIKLLAFLSGEKGCTRISAQNLRGRIIEIYRRCYEQFPAKRESHLRDFVAHFPQLVFEAESLRKLVGLHTYTRQLEPHEPRNRFFSLSSLPKQNLTASRSLVHAHGLVNDDLLAKVLP